MSSKFRKLMKFLPNFFMVIGAVTVAFAMLLSMVNLPVSAGDGNDPNVCPMPSDGMWVKQEGSGENSNTYGWVSIDNDKHNASWGANAGYEVTGACMKGSGILADFGAGSNGGSYDPYLCETNNGNQYVCHEISHVVVYFGVVQGDPTTETVVPTTETVVPTTETVVPTTETVVPTTETVVPTTETVVPTTETVVPTEIPGDPNPSATPGPETTPDPESTPDPETTPDPPVVSEEPDPEATLAPPTTSNNPTVLIPVTGIEFGAPMNKVQSFAFNLGLGLLGVGLVLQSIRKKIK